MRGQSPSAIDQGELWRHRNLGKAFYENPTTQLQAVEEFKKALDLAPDSARERLNYGLALLRAGKMTEGVAEMQKVQTQQPKMPHTWFNLGILFKKSAQYDQAIQQFQGMVALVPDEPMSRYNLGVLYKLTGKPDLALKQFEVASKLDPNLAGPHFQLSNSYRALGRSEDADREIQLFQQIKKRQAGAAVPEDLEWSSYAEIYDVIEPKASGNTTTAPEPRFKDVPLPGSLTPENVGLIVLDADGDGVPDLLAWSAGGVRLYRSGAELLKKSETRPSGNGPSVESPRPRRAGSEITHTLELVEASGLADLKNVISIAPGDFNNDGLVDLCVITNAESALYVNKKGSFEKQPAQLPAGHFRKAVWLDFDHDGDIDLFLLGEKSVLVRNEGTAGFSDHTAGFPFVSGSAIDGMAFDLIKDTNGIDLVVTHQDRGAVLYRDKLAGKFEAVPLEVLPAGAHSLLACDLDNDGWTDIAAASEAGVILLGNNLGRLQSVSAPEGGRGLIVFADLENKGALDLLAGGSFYRNQGLFRFAAGKALADSASPLAAVAADFDGDGRVDLAVADRKGNLHIFRNEMAAGNQWLGVSLLGVKNLQLAPGAEVEVKAGALYQKEIYAGVPLLFGLGSYKEADAVRITWPNGLIQNEIKQPAGKAAQYKEKQRLSGSCPMVFAWNGKAFQFITDVLGVAPLGAASGDGEYFPVDHDEYIQIPGDSLVPIEGKYQIRITEELHEVAYLDKVQLFAVDHPAGMDIFTNVKFQSPPYPELRLFGTSKRVYPTSARDDKKNDVLNRILKSDRTYIDSFKRDYSGVAELHSLELDFGREVAPDNRALLVLHGWVDWADGSTFLRASQEKKGGLIMPYLQVKDASGRWHTVVADMGIPAGKPKTIVVDLSGKFLSSSREVRIVSNICVYWDEIFLSEKTGAPEVSMTSVKTDFVELQFGGFSRLVIHPERKQPEWFDYSRRTSLSMWNPTPGWYTSYGDVRELLSSVDDRFVIMGSGDELHFLFNAEALPQLKSGMRRDFLLLVDGWAKDADLNTAHSQTVEPLPFHSMSRYPYPPSENYPDDQLHRDYRRQYNARPALRLLRPLNEQLATKSVEN
jgi:tetratricopeptide (TPR) repeat protein